MDLFGTAAHWFGRGGFVMYLLLLASIGAVSIIIERARYYRRKRQRFHFFIQQWRKDAAVYDVSELAVRYGKSHRVLNRLAAAACHAAENGAASRLPLKVPHSSKRPSSNAVCRFSDVSLHWRRFSASWARSSA